MIIGATPTPDKEILQTSASLYTKYKLKRVYYSAFSPIPHAASTLPGISPPLLREHRLYQADWMLRFYGFSVQDIVSEATPNLDIDIDPKTSWALRNPAYFPIDINTASREQLLRVPGFGVRSIQTMLSVRRYKRLRLEDILRLRVAWNRAKAFVIAADYKPSNQLQHPDHLQAYLRPSPTQLSFTW